MKKFIAIVALSLALTAPVAPAFAGVDENECQTLASSFGPAKELVDRKKAELEVLAAQAEEAGELWQNAENVRTLGADAASEADALRVAYDQKKAAFNTVDIEFFDASSDLNRNITYFNRVCVTD